MIKRPITTNQLPPAREPVARPRKSLTTNALPLRLPAIKTKFGFGRVISTNNIEEIQAENRGGETPKKRGRPMIKRPITTNQLPPAREPVARPRKSLTTNALPLRLPAIKTKFGFGRVISTNNIEEIQAENRGGETPKKRGRPKGK
jgi:hypothetical protein